MQITGHIGGLMDDLAHSAPEEVAKRLRALAAGLTNPADIAAVNKYADELERASKRPQSTAEGK
jgi:hypothetical protein